jgi:hypothetical protein
LGWSAASVLPAISAALEMGLGPTAASSTAAMLQLARTAFDNGIDASVVSL